MNLNPKAAAFAIVLAAGAACGPERRDTAPKPAAATAEAKRLKELDRLWSYAPKEAKVGLVITGEALRSAEMARGFLSGLLAGKTHARDLMRELVAEPRDAQMAGMDVSRGFAGFITVDGAMMVVPVVDRDAFVAALGGQRELNVDRVRHLVCGPVGDLYVCGFGAAALEQIAPRGGDLGRSAGVGGRRGDAELVARQSLGSFGWPDYFVAGNLTTAVLELRGSELVARAHHAGRVEGPLAALIDLTATASPLEGVSGFVTVPLGPLFSQSLVPAPLDAKHAANFTGPLVFTTAYGSNDGEDLRGSVPVRDRTLAQSFLEICRGAFATPAQPDPEACEIRLRSSPQAFEVRLEGLELRATRRTVAPRPTPAPVPLTPIASELAAYPIAFWGRGETTGVPLKELGFGGRVTSSGIDLMFVIRTGPAGEVADDVAAGSAGIAFAIRTLKLVTTDLFPRVREVTLDGFAGEAARFLDEVGSAARVYHMTHGSYPVGETAWTSTRGCCFHHNRICETDAQHWTADPIWSALGVSVPSPHRFVYRYQGTRDRFEVKAEADLDCDGDETTRMWATGTFENGGPAVKFGRQVEPH
jgi:hypothetical protein